MNLRAFHLPKSLCLSARVSLQSPQDATATGLAAAPFLLPPSEQETSARSAGKAAPSAAEDAAPAPAPAMAPEAPASQDEVHIEINETPSLGNGSDGFVCPPCTTPASSNGAEKAGTQPLIDSPN